MKTRALFGIGGLLVGFLAILTGCGWDNTDTFVDGLEPPESPEAVLNANVTSGNAPLGVKFDGSSSSAPEEAEINKYEWSLGNDSTATGVSVAHTYTAPGEYTVKLTVTTNEGATDSDSVQVTVHPNEEPKATFSISPTNPRTNETVTFDASDSTDTAGLEAQEIVGYRWNFGDGATASGKVVEHRYADDGDYDVSLTLKDDGDKTSSTTKTISVQNRSPNAEISASPTNGSAPLTVAFNASASSDPDGSIRSYEWAFGDGNSSSGEVVSHTYADDGTFTAALTVTDDDGGTASSSMIIEVTSANENSFTPKSYSGSGDDVISIVTPEYDPFLLDISGNEQGHYFSVTGYNSSGDLTELFVNSTELYDGVLLDPSGETVELEVSADGSWKIEVQSLNYAETVDIPGEITGTNDDVFLLAGIPSTAHITGNAEEHYFGVKSYTAEGILTDILVNEVSVYEGRVQVPKDTEVMVVKASGDWTIVME